MGTKMGMRRKTARPAYFPTKKRRSSTALTKLKNELSKERSKSRVLRKDLKAGSFVSGSGLKMQASATIIGGGALAGIIAKQMPTVAGVASPIAVGVASTAVGMILSNSNPTISGVLGCLGAGMLASEARSFTTNILG